MIRALCGKAVGDAKLLFAATIVVMYFFPWIFIWMTSKVSLPAFSRFLASALPPQWERLSGVPFSEVATPAGRVALMFAHPLIVFGAMAWAIARGSDCVSGEIGRGTMEMLLAQPVRRTSVYATQALVTILGSALLASAAWFGTATGLATIQLSENVPADLFIPAAINLFGLMICLGGASALASSCDNQRWRTVGLIGAFYAVSMLLAVVGRIADGWHWLRYASFMSAYEPQAMVARPDEAWSLFVYQHGAVSGFAIGALQLVLFGVGILSYVAGALIFARREIPAPL